MQVPAPRSHKIRPARRAAAHTNAAALPAYIIYKDVKAHTGISAFYRQTPACFSVPAQAQRKQTVCISKLVYFSYGIPGRRTDDCGIIRYTASGTL